MIVVRKNIPKDEVDSVKNIFLAAGATEIRSLPEPDGEFTLIVTLPDDQTHDDQHTAMMQGLT